VPQPDQQFRVNSAEVTSKILDGEAIVINLSDGVYYSLVGPGAVVWAMAIAGSGAQKIADELISRYGDTADDVLLDVESLLDKLAAERLLVPAEEGEAAEPVADDLPSGGDYSPPELEKYTDMSDMLALDPPLPGIRELPWQAHEGSQSS
jgi:hypothetical protein